MLKQIAHDNVVELNMQRPPVNALNGELVSALDQAIREASAQGYKAIVVSGQPGMFSAGLDVPELLGLNRDGMSRFWCQFFGLLECVARSPLPVAMAITGHSPAGGAVLSLFADYRVMASGDYKIGLNEVQVGLVVPPMIQAALVRLVGAHAAERLMVAGALITPDQAARVGLVDELADSPEDALARALAWSRKHAALPQVAMAETRRLARASLTGLFDDRSELGVESFVEHWFHDATQEVLQGLVARLKKG